MDQKKPSSNESSPVSFSPVTEGLGFHPFSEGLPYSPSGKSQKPKPAPTSGTGAVSAGSPRIAQAARAADSKRSFEKKISSSLQEQKPILAPLQATIPSAPLQAIQPLQVQNRKYYLLKRMIAYGFDFWLSTFLFSLLIFGYFQLDETQQTALVSGFFPKLFKNTKILYVLPIGWLGFHWAWMTFQETLFKTTFGKRVFRLKLKGSGIMIFLRACFFLPGLALGGLGILWSLVDSQKRCWHDKIVDVQPT